MAKQLQLSAKITVCRYNELTDSEKKWVDAAREAAKKAYAPYSRFRVGAAVALADGEIITGNNQENDSYPEGLCAERVALFAAGAAAGARPVAITLAAIAPDGKSPLLPVTPCGGCRQVMREVESRYGAPLRVLMCGAEEIYIAASAGDLLPLSFELSATPQA